MADNEADRQFDSESPRRLVSTLFFFFTYLLAFINEDRNTVSSPPPLKTVFIEEVAYVKKIIVTGGIK